MKISIHTMYFLPEFGSVPILMNELATYLAQRGHPVEVMATLPRPPHDKDYPRRLFFKEERDGFIAKRIMTNFTKNPLGRLLAWTLYTLASFINLFSIRRGGMYCFFDCLLCS